MSASSIKMGGVFVEIGADARKFFTALNHVNKSLANMGKGLVSGGAKLGAAGIGMAAPIAAAVKQGASFESVLLGIRASTGMAATEVEKVKAAALGMSQALGVGPTAAAQGMLELLKAGVPVEKVLGGVGQAALQFAKVGEMDVAQAAVVMSDAMNVFGVSGTKAADTLSAAADASSTSITQMAEAFSMSSAVAGLANQNIDDLSAALALLANAGVKGSDAGTSIKTMLMRLMAPAEDGAKALADIGLATDSFRGADGKMKPLVEILGTLNGALGGLDQTAKDDVFRRIFGADAIRAASILSSAGVDGFQGMRDAMSQALPVGEKFKTLMSGMAGGGLRVLASLERLSIVIADALGPAIGKLVPLITGAIDGFADFAAKNKEAVTLYAQVAAAAIGIGGAMVGLGYALQVVATGFGGIGKAVGVFGLFLNPVVLVTAGVLGAAAAAYKFRGAIAESFGSVGALVGQAAGAIGEFFAPAVSDAIAVFGDLYQTASSTFSGIYDAIVAGDLSSAMDILWAGLVAGWLRGVEAIMSYVDPWIASFQDAFTIMGGEIYKGFDALWVSVAGVLNNAGAVLMGVMDNIINGILASWDFLEASIRKAWIRVSGIFKSGEDKKRELDAVDADMKGRAAEREKNRPGVKGRLEKAANENADAERGMIARGKAVDAATQDTIAGREAANAARAQERRQGVIGAEARLADLTSGAAMKRADMESLPGIQDALASVKSVSELGAIGQQISGMLDRDTLTADQEAKALAAYRAAADRIAAEAGASSGDAAAAAAGAAGAGDQAKESMGKIAGTFSSLNLGQAFGGSSVAERTARAAEETAKGVKELVGQGGGKVAA